MKSSLLLFPFWIATFLFVVSGCGPKRVHFLGPGHDADWPIEAQDAHIYNGYLRAQHLSNLGKVDEAIAAFEETLKHDPQSPLLLTRTAEEYLRKGDLAKSEQLTQLAVGVNPRFREGLFLMGKIHGVKKEWSLSEEAFKKVIELDLPGSDEEGVIALATVYVDSKRPEKAIAVLQELVERNPNHLLGYYYLGRVYSELDRMEDAIRSYEKAVSINPSFSSALKAIALIYEYQGKKEEAIESLLRVLEIEIDNNSVRNHLGQLYLEKNDIDSALNQFEIVARDQPKDTTARLRIGLIYLQKQNYKKADEILSSLVKEAPDLHRVRYYSGVVKEKLGDSGGAMKEFTQVDTTADVYVEARLGLAFLQEESGDIVVAEKTIRTALKQHPNSAELHAGLASLLTKQKRGEEAIRLLQEAISKAPKDETLWFSLGEVYEKTGKTEDLYRSMKTVLEINPDNANALNYLGYTYAEKGIRLEEAEQLIVRALQAKPKDGYITDSLGWVYFKKGEFDKAVKKLEEANRLAPNDPTIMEHLADALEKVGEKKRAGEIYRQILQVAKEDDVKKRVQEKIDKLSLPHT